MGLFACVWLPSGHQCSDDLLNVKWTVVGRETPCRRVGWKLFSISRPDCERAPVVSGETGPISIFLLRTRGGPLTSLTAFEEKRAQTICAITAFMSLSHSQRARRGLLGGHHSRWQPDAGWEVAMLAVYPPLRLISRVHRDREARTITSVAVAYNHFLSSLLRPPATFALFPHTIIYLFIPFSVFLFATLIFFSLSPDLSGQKKRPKWRLRRGRRHAKRKTPSANPAANKGSFSSDVSDR